MILKAVKQRVAGSVLKQDKHHALVLHGLDPEGTAANIVNLRFALVTRGPGDHIFPSFLLDDWGREIRGLKLYDWIRENGERFPRGEIFGFEQDGRETQVFLRELELYARLPCYAYETAGQGIADGLLIAAIILPDASVAAPQPVKMPQGLRRPLRDSRVTWWQAPDKWDTLSLEQLQLNPDPGY